MAGQCFAGNSALQRGVWILQAVFVQVLSNWCIHIHAELQELCNNGAATPVERCVWEKSLVAWLLLLQFLLS